MKKLLLFGLIVLFCSGCATVTNNFYSKSRISDKFIKNTDPKAKENRSIVILQEFTYQYARLPDFLSRALTESLMANNYIVVSRSNMKNIVEEQKMAASGFVKNEDAGSSDISPLDKNTLAKIGELTGANTIMLVYMTPKDATDIQNVSIRFVDISTAEVIFVFNLINDYKYTLSTDNFIHLFEFVLKEHKKGVKKLFVYQLEFDKEGNAIVAYTADGKQKDVNINDVIY